MQDNVNNLNAKENEMKARKQANLQNQSSVSFGYMRFHLHPFRMKAVLQKPVMLFPNHQASRKDCHRSHMRKLKSRHHIRLLLHGEPLLADHAKKMSSLNINFKNMVGQLTIVAL